MVDLTDARSDGRLTVAADGHLFLLGKGGRLIPFARGSGGYSTALGPEPYVALATGHSVTGMKCSFPRDAVYAIEPGGRPGVISIDVRGRTRRVVNLPGVRPDGITFDSVGRFGYRLLVTSTAHGPATVVGIDCAGRVTTISSHAPSVEGGIAVAPRSFGAFAGDLVAPDEKSGRVWAIGPHGRARIIVRSPLPSGSDVGVESAGFVPARFGRNWSAYVADRHSRGNRHPGTNSILRLSGAQMIGVGVSPGDLVIAGEGGGATIVIRCARTCSTRYIADGPTTTSHLEGHVVFAPPLR